MLELVREPTAIRQPLQQFANTIGFDRFAYGHIQGTDTRIFWNYPGEGFSGRYDRSCGREPR